MTETVTRIEIKEKGTKEFYKEVVSVTNQYLGLIKKPDRKLRDSFGQLKGYIVLCSICFAVPLIMGIAWGMDALTWIALVVVLAALLLSALLLYRLNNMVRSYMADPLTSVFTLDEAGIELDKEGSQVIRIAWDNVAFVREFNESVCFFSKSVQGLIRAVSKTYRQQVFDHLRDNAVNVRIIER